MLDFRKPRRVPGDAGVRAEAGEQPAPADVRVELQRIMNSSQFDASERNRRFLEYIVEETLSGRGNRIKAYCIATVVFGRNDSFDPANDPVVRMEARRLRRSLERFYLVEGDSGPVRIALPKGGYVPEFPGAGQMPTAGGIRHSFDDDGFRSCGHSILVAPFELECRNTGEVNYSDGFARQIVVGLSRIPQFSVFMPCPFSRLGNNSDLRTRAETTPDVDLVLAGNAVIEPDKFRAKVTLQNARSGRIVWAETLEGDIATHCMLGARDEIAGRIVHALSERLIATRPDALATVTPLLP